jgi:hypothetical protein
MYLDGLQNKLGSFRGFAVDTTFVLFFLGLEFGRTIQNFTFDGFLLLVTMLMVGALPYYLISDDERPAFAKWLAGRGLITFFAIFLGAVLNSTYGSTLPESFRFMPLTLLIIAAMTSCFLRFYGLMRLRLAK